MHQLDHLLGSILAAARWLSLPIAALLFLQWPLREVVQAGSREANDFGQWLFALFVALSIVAATRARQHIATDVASASFSARTRRGIAACGLVFGLIPWALFVLWAAAPLIAQSVRLLERFPDTANPGYFMIKVALGVLVVAALGQAIAGRFGRDGDRS